MVVIPWWCTMVESVGNLTSKQKDKRRALQIAGVQKFGHTIFLHIKKKIHFPGFVQRWFLYGNRTIGKSLFDSTVWEKMWLVFFPNIISKSKLYRFIAGGDIIEIGLRAVCILQGWSISVQRAWSHTFFAARLRKRQCRLLRHWLQSPNRMVLRQLRLIPLQFHRMMEQHRMQLHRWTQLLLRMAWIPRRGPFGKVSIQPSAIAWEWWFWWW